MIDDYSYCSRNNKINDLGGKWRDLEEQNRIKQGRYLNKLADTCNQPYTIISAPKSTGKSIIKQYITLGLALFSRVGFGDRRVSDNLLNGQIPADQDVFPMAQARNVPVAPFNLWQQVHNFAMMPKFNDPLRFPSAQAATFHIPTLSGNSDEDIHFELDLLIMHKSMNQGRKEFLRTGVANEKTNHLYNIAWVIDILLQAIATKNFHSSTFVKVAMIITKHTPTRIKETFDGIKNVILIDNWLEQQTFGTQVDQYLAKLIFDNRHKENFSISDINKNLNTTLQHLYEQFLPETGLAVKQYIEQIVTREFPAFGYKNFRSQREVFQWGFSHIGYSFLPLASVYANQFSSEETYALGYNLYTLFKKGLLHTELVKIFIIPAMIFHTHHFRNNDLSTFTDFLNLESFQHSALKAYFNYNPEHDIVENAIRSFHTSFNKFIDFFLSPDETTNHTERRLDFRTRRNTLIERHIEADQTFITAALLALDPPTQDIIRKSVITFGTFTFSLPNEKTSNQDAIADIIYRATHQDFKAPPYIHIFKCLYKNRIEHIFALKQLETGYVIKKVDQDVTLYRELLTDNDKHGYRHYTNLSLRFFSERDYIPKKLGLINLAKYFADKHSAVLKESLYEFDWCGFDPEDVKQKLLSINQVPFHQCFTGIDGAQASLTLLQSSVNRVKNMIPYYRINTDWIDEMNDDVFLKRVVQRDALPAYAMSLAMNNSIQQAPLRDKSAHQAYDAAGPDEQQSITENAISGGLNELYTQGSQSFFSLDKMTIYVALNFGEFYGKVNPVLKQALEKIDVLTGNQYLSPPQCAQDVLLPEDHYCPD